MYSLPKECKTNQKWPIHLSKNTKRKNSKRMPVVHPQTFIFSSSLPPLSPFLLPHSPPLHLLCWQQQMLARRGEVPNKAESNLPVWWVGKEETLPTPSPSGTSGAVSDMPWCTLENVVHDHVNSPKDYIPQGTLRAVWGEREVQSSAACLQTGLHIQAGCHYSCCHLHSKHQG